ncbi:MAG: beta-propeller fold lactonase family protein [Planctomycetota bacterium]
MYGKHLALLIVALGFALGGRLFACEEPAKSAAPDPRYPVDGGSKRSQYAVAEDDLYKSPISVLYSADRLYVVCEESKEVLCIDPATGRVVARAEVGRHPFGITASPDGRRLYVSNRRDGTISVLEPGGDRLKVLNTFRVGDAPHGLVTDASGEVLYVANTHTDDVALIDTKSLKEIKRLAAGRYPFEVARSPDGKRIYVSSVLSASVPFRAPPEVEITFIDTASRAVVDRRRLPSTVISQGITVTPDSRFVVVALELPKNLLPETQMFQGWMVTHGVAILEAEEGGRSAFLLLDEPHLYFANAYGVRFSPDGGFLYVSSSGVDTVSVVDFSRVAEILKLENGKIGITDEEIERYARHLGLSSEHVVARLPTRNDPMGIAVAPDQLWVAERLNDTVAVFDTDSRQQVLSVDLGGPRVVTPLRRGAQLFNSAQVSFQRQLSCTTCHPENHLDGLTYDIGLDGIGQNLVDNRTMRGIADTGPFKWSGKNPTIARQEGPRAAQLFFRSHGFEADDNECVVQFIESLPVLENRFRPARKYNEFQRRGKVLFERDRTTDGRYIPIQNRCVTCHPAPYYSDGLKHNVGTKAEHDTDPYFDTPQLNNVHLQAPYLHDGRCYSLEEIWTRFNPDDTHGQTNDMTKEMLNDLIEYLKTL